MTPRTLIRIGTSALAALVILLTVVAAGYTQTDSQPDSQPDTGPAGQIYLPLIQQEDPAVDAAGQAGEIQAYALQDQAMGDFDYGALTKKQLPTIVLVHGAWADGTGWQEIIPRLLYKGYNVVAVQNPLTSLADDVATTKRLIDAETANGPVIAVGHSYGGAVITGAAAGNPNVKALVYIAAFAPEVGEPIGAFLGQYPTELGEVLRLDAAGFAYLDRTRFRAVFAADVSRSTAMVMAAAQKPTFIGIFEESLPAAAWKTIPSWYMVATKDRSLSPDLERFYAQRMGATTVEVRSSHVPFISRPTEVVRLIEQAAKATAD